MKQGQFAGQDAVLQRVGKSRYPLQLLYVMEPSTNIRPKFWFRPTVERGVKRRLRKSFGKALNRYALRCQLSDQKRSWSGTCDSFRS